MDDLTPILQRIPQFASAKSPEIKELTGGITNKNYKITVDGESFVLRMGGNETKYLGIDRKIEYECSLLASQIGIAPEPIAFLEPEGYIVVRFISGKGIPAEEIGTEENIKRVIERSEEHTSELQSPCNIVCRLLLEKKKKKTNHEQATIPMHIAIPENTSLEAA